MLKSFMNFDNFVFPKLVTIIYWIGIVLIGLGTIIGFFGSLVGMSNPYGSPAVGLGAALVTLLGGVIGLVLWRLVIEFWLVIFSIRDLLRDIRDQRKI